MEKLSDGRGSYYFFVFCFLLYFCLFVSEEMCLYFSFLYSVALVLNLASRHVVSFAIFYGCGFCQSSEFIVISFAFLCTLTKI